MDAKAQTASLKPAESKGRVRFEFFHPGAKSVCVAGSFNGWNPTATRMASAGHGHWLRDLWLPPGTYEYLLVVDGEWVFDTNTTDYVPNVFGGMNAVVEISSAPKPSRGDAHPKSTCAPRRRTTEGEKTASRVACCV